ncbi:hypothetical protein DSO57_1036371 [Entomophthora muscae]|uniref:Uncharacterized protein n=1 Tax=Entomophthora muscae TaxID=34485 RepID=A0ACC2SCA1_9FUNG|nr:hypothetical protein DSO57_1036371 [Entomophthora muscae]
MAEGMSYLQWPKNWASALWSRKEVRTREGVVRSRPSSFFEGKSVKQADLQVAPLSTEKPAFESRAHPLQPTGLVPDASGPLHTNRWWQNLTLGEGTGFLGLYPYLVQTKDSGCIVCYPAQVATADYVISPFVANWELQVAGNSSMVRKLINADDLGCAVKWGDKLKAYFVRGAPYVTFDVMDGAIKLVTIHAILEVVTSNLRTRVTLNSGQVWVFYTQSPVAWSHTMNELTMASSYTGILRMAMVPGPVESNLAMLDTFSSTYPVGGSVVYEFPNDNQSYIHFNFNKQGGNLPLLMLSMPHHQECLVNLSNAELTGYRSIKGPLTAVVGDQWTMLEVLCPIQWFSPTPVASSLRQSIQEALAVDANMEIDPDIKDPYFYGKAVAKIARLALIAEACGSDHLIKDLVAKCKRYLEPWLSGSNEDSFLYDTTWGGIVTKDGMDDSGADFGNGWYNDHHFHYGYFLYASAVVGKYEAGWVYWWRERLMLLIRDFANPSSTDPFFPKFRYKDFFDGHSWASGLFEFGDGKNQESTSESVNAYYAMYLLALTLKDQQLARISNLLLTTELRSSRKYWHMDSQHDVYPPVFAQGKTVGVLWGTKVDYATWFGKNAEYIHCIQMLPFTPISHVLLDKPWIKEAYPVLAQALTRNEPPIPGGWRTFVHMARAVIEPQQALEDFNRSPKEMDDGNTLSNTLYWFATQA